MKSMRFLILTGFLALTISSTSLAQVDPTKALLGTWEGHIEASNVSGGAQRTLIINSVKATGSSEWEARGRFGVTGQVKEGPGGQEMSVSSKDNEIFVEFVGGQSKAPVRLKLVGDNKLDGTIGVFDRGRVADRRISLEKTK